ncbi:MAG: alpha/beta fold hydrolase, partial [Desulfobacterales bacterium]
MFVKRYGSGPRTFLCLHGWGGDHREFVPVTVRMPADVCVLSVDLPGYGKSPKPTRWSLAAIVDEVCAAPEIQGAELITLVGFCSGAIFALLVAARDPARVRRVVMIDPFAFIPWYFRIFLAGKLGRRAYHTTFQTRMGRAITDWVFKRMQVTDADFTRAFTML